MLGPGAGRHCFALFRQVAGIAAPSCCKLLQKRIGQRSRAAVNRIRLGIRCGLGVVSAGLGEEEGVMGGWMGGWIHAADVGCRDWEYDGRCFE
jgi:hypothetical protein